MKVRPPKDIWQYLRPLANEAHRKNIVLYVVGGCVRDWIFGTETKDVDLLTETDPAPLAHYCVKKWHARIEPFSQFGTIRCYLGQGGRKNSGNEGEGLRLDFVRARAESYPAPAVLPEVRPGTLADDLARRDFTINAMAAKIGDGPEAEVIDLNGGLKDIRSRQIRVLHSNSFRDDPTRLFRAARYGCRYRMKFARTTENQARDAIKAGYADRLSRERIRNELLRILSEKEPACALGKIQSLDLVRLFHSMFAWPKIAEKGQTALERLGLIAIELDRRSRRRTSSASDGIEFVRGLNLERSASREILNALEFDRVRGSARSPLGPLCRRILQLSHPDIADAALKPLLLTGKDLQKFELKPGPRFRDVLDAAAEAQWAGEFSTRAQALRWLRAELGVVKK